MHRPLALTMETYAYLYVAFLLLPAALGRAVQSEDNSPTCTFDLCLCTYIVIRCCIDSCQLIACPHGLPVVNCIVDPCTVMQCDATCVPNYCGGCHARCTAGKDFTKRDLGTAASCVFIVMPHTCITLKFSFRRLSREGTGHQFVRLQLYGDVPRSVPGLYRRMCT